MKFKINKQVFDKFPDLFVALPIIQGFDNTTSHAEALTYLRDQEKKLRETVSLEQFLQDKRVLAYQDAFRDFGVDPVKFKPAHIALASRVLEGKDLPDINPLANLYNAMSIEYLTPYGGEDLDTVCGDFELAFAQGGEQWIPIGGGKAKPAIKGELIWGDDYDISTRALNWRQCDRTKLTELSKNGYFVMDGFGQVNKELIEKASKQFIEIATKLFGGRTQIYWLDKENPEIEISFVSKKWDKGRIFVESVKQLGVKKVATKSNVQTKLVGVAKEIKEIVDQALAELKLETAEFSVTHPKEESHGDYSVNVAMILWGKNKELRINEKSLKSPREVAGEIVNKIQDSRFMNQELIEKVEVAGAGFINFYLKLEFYFAETKKAIEPGYGSNDNLQGKKVMVEYTDPNPFKEMHIGHLMSNTIGESLVRLFEASGAEVKRVCYQGDVGLHVAKSVWGMGKMLGERSLNLGELQDWPLHERQQFMGQAYAYGAGQYEADPSVGEAGETAKVQMHALNKEIYEGLAQPAGSLPEGVMNLYHTGRAWSLEYFETIYQRLGTKFDEYFFESEAGPVGLSVVQEGLDKGVLEVGDEGAVVYKGEKDGLHTRVFRNKLSLPTYEAKDLGLAKTKWGRYKYDLSYIVTANEITEYFKVVLRVMEQLYPELRAKTTHKPHGMMKLTSGKMSSRSGVVVTGEGLLNDLQAAVLSKMSDPTSPKATQGQGRDIANKEVVADTVAVGALKYTVLKQAIGGDIIYESEKMTNLEGNTGPFVQYTYARCSSILRKFQILNPKFQINLNDPNYKLATQELSILRWIYRYPEVVEEAGAHYAPHLVATYIYELSQRFNSFYQACRVEEKGEVNPLRYLLTQATASVLKSGLGLLGIQSPEEM